MSGSKNRADIRVPGQILDCVLTVDISGLRLASEFLDVFLTMFLTIDISGSRVHIIF